MTGRATIMAGLILWLMFWLALPAMGEDNRSISVPGAAKTQPATGAKAPMTDIHDIRPPVPVGIDAPWLLPALLAMAAATLLAAAWWWRRKRRDQRTIEDIVPELPPETIAMQALNTISDVRRLDGKTFYFRLSAILRQYVSGRFAVGAPEMTTEEFAPCIDRLPVDRELGGQLKQLCRSMDPVKFGGMTTLEKQMEADLFFVRAFVRRTSPTHDPDHPTDDAGADAVPIPEAG